MMKVITINKTTNIKPLNYDDKSHPSTRMDWNRARAAYRLVKDWLTVTWLLQTIKIIKKF